MSCTLTDRQNRAAAKVAARLPMLDHDVSPAQFVDSVLMTIFTALSEEKDRVADRDLVAIYTSILTDMNLEEQGIDIEEESKKTVQEWFEYHSSPGTEAEQFAQGERVLAFWNLHPECETYGDLEKLPGFPHEDQYLRGTLFSQGAAQQPQA